MWNVFISHASEDKEAVAQPLAAALSDQGFNVWFDNFTLKVGDSLRRSIDRGLASADYGIVILSPSFFAKEWPQRELDALFSREEIGKTVILPVWHKIDARELAKISPMLANRLAADTSRGISNVVRQITSVTGRPGKPSLREAQENLNAYELVLFAFRPTSYDSLDQLTKKESILGRLAYQERAIRLFLGVDTPVALSPADGRVLLSAFVPPVDPNGIGELKASMTSTDLSDEMKQAFANFEVLESVTPLDRPDLITIQKLYKSGFTSAQNYLQQYYAKIGVAAAVSDELKLLLSRDLPTTVAAMILMDISRCDGKLALPDFLYRSNGLFSRFCRGWATHEAMLFGAEVQLVTELDSKGMNGADLNLIQIDDVEPMLNFLTRRLVNLNKAQTALMQDFMEISEKVWKDMLGRG